MGAEMSLGNQLDALINRIGEEVLQLATVVGLEEMEEALEVADLLPAAVVVFSGDYPEKDRGGLSAYPGQKLYRYWSIILVMELNEGPGDALDLLEAVRDAGVGFRICRGTKPLSAAGSRFITKYDTRAIYEVRFVTMTTL